MSVGKKIGLFAFVVSEILSVIFTIIILFFVFKSGQLDASLISAVLLFQGSVFTVVWGAKASSNFTKKEG
jgi:hypothetical protein